MELLSLLGHLLDLNQWMVLLMFISFMLLLIRGIPVVYSLVGVSLIYSLIAVFILDPNYSLINNHIDFDKTRISYIKLSSIYLS